MKDHATDSGRGAASPVFQVIVLGSGGGPNEENVTGFLVRSTATRWSRSSLLAVDAGTHLAAITRILDERLPLRPDEDTPRKAGTGKAKVKPRPSNGSSSPAEARTPLRRGRAGAVAVATPDAAARPARPRRLTSGAFAGLEVPFASAAANAAFITRELVATYLITHPHLDHISGFVVNTASFQHTSRPKRLAALPSTIDAIKTHIFNDLIWPNLSDEEGGVGLVSYMRLAEGGNVAIGEGDGRGYIEVCDGLGVRSWSVSHGTCMKPHERGHDGGTEKRGENSRRVSLQGGEDRRYAHLDRRSVYDSTAFFIRDYASGKEVLIFGDVEPDKLSLSPRTAIVWTEAARKMAAGLLTGVFIECSYDDSQPDELLFGHLAPRHLIEELKFLAAAVLATEDQRDSQAPLFADPLTTMTNVPPLTRDALRKRKRPRSASSRPEDARRPRRSGPPSPSPVATPLGGSPAVLLDDAETDEAAGEGAPGPLTGLRVVIIHMKDTLRDGPAVGVPILQQLLAYEEQERLGCEFVIARAGESVWL